jgi:hypothetical protein
MDTTIEETLRFHRVEPTFLTATAVDALARDRAQIERLLVNPDWQNKLIEHLPLSDLRDFSGYRKDLLRYPEYPTPEKQPINRLYFEFYGAIACDYLKSNYEGTDDLKIGKVSLRIFENGSICVRCSTVCYDPFQENSVNRAIEIVRSARILSGKLTLDVIRSFALAWNECFPDHTLLQPENTVLFEYYEYIDFDVLGPNGEPVIKTIKNEGSLDYLRELAGFCRMAKRYTWPNYSKAFLSQFMSNDVGGRDDELWLAYPERFVRCFPNKDVPATAAYASDIILVAEGLLGLRAMYKMLLEHTRSRLTALPAFIIKTSGVRVKSRMDRIQQDFVIITYRLSRCYLPSYVHYYAKSAFALSLFYKLEIALGLDKLPVTALQQVIDALRNLLAHQENRLLQQRLFWLTVVIGVIGILLATTQIVTAFLK